MLKDATAMAKAVRDRHISAKELVLDTIQKAEKINPVLNAITSQRYEKALQEASSRDWIDQPFAGVPIFLKDLTQYQAGEPSTAGSVLLQSNRAEHSDNYVKKLEKLGFIILGRTNTPEFGFKNISDSQLHGAVSLPDDPSRNAGGSSGGAAALVAAGVTPLAPASDGGGSIRIPASFNGLIGLKPTRGRIPVGPSSYRGWQGASVHFALTQSVRDTRRLLYYLQTYQVEAPFPLKKLSHRQLFETPRQALKIAMVLNDPKGNSLPQEAQKALKQAANFLKEQGHTITILDKTPLDNMEVISNYYVMNAAETAAMFGQIEASLGRQLQPSDMELMTWVIYQAGQHVAAKTYSTILQSWDRYSHIMAKFHENYDLLLLPTTNYPAPKHGALEPSKSLKEVLRRITAYHPQEQLDLIWQMFEKSFAYNPYTSQANLTGQPAISLPTYRTQEGLAMGIQLIAAKGREELLLAVADQFEQGSGFK